MEIFLAQFVRDLDELNSNIRTNTLCLCFGLEVSEVSPFKSPLLEKIILIINRQAMPIDDFEAPVKMKTRPISDD